MPANRSTKVLTMEAMRVLRKYSPMNSDVEKAIGKEMISASIEVNSVPAINNNAP